MIAHNEDFKEITLQNNDMTIVLCYENGICVKDWLHANIGSHPRPGCGREIFILDIEGMRLHARDFLLTGVVCESDSTQELVSITQSFAFDGNKLAIRFSLVNNEDDTVDLIFQLKARWKCDIPLETHLLLPFLSDFPLASDEDITYHFPLNPCPKPDGSPMILVNYELNMPLGIMDKGDSYGFCFYLPCEFPPVQNNNSQIHFVQTVERLKNLQLLIRPNIEFTDILVTKVKAIKRGWPEFFNVYKRNIRQKYRFDEYQKPENQWYKSTYIHHFTYLYGKEIYNYQEGKVEPVRLAAQGEEFGGYDAVLLWHQYPRLGADSRTQWDFFDEFPGGRDGLRDITKQFHDIGIRVFLPFKPWDLHTSQSLDGAGTELARLVKDTDIDGVFLDTMSSIPPGFRQAVDNVKKGVVFCSESQPDGQKEFEVLTGSWDQYPGNPEVDINLVRFVFPEHYEPVIARWSTGIRKDILIKRAIFNGTGLVIWQDVFGAWLPYSPEQKQLIKKWKAVLSQNSAAFFGSNPIPHYPTLQKGLYCNYFPADDGLSAIFCLYNATGESIRGEMFVLDNTNLKYASECLNGLEAEIVDLNGKRIVKSTLDAHAVSVIKAAAQ
ncbi:MAG TPA: hypothetical protein PLZ84_00625 [Clostridia bacterium]|nr:hypothetical protein [Clostridia bacterium]